MCVFLSWLGLLLLSHWSLTLSSVFLSFFMFSLQLVREKETERQGQTETDRQTYEQTDPPPDRNKEEEEERAVQGRGKRKTQARVRKRDDDVCRSKMSTSSTPYRYWSGRLSFSSCMVTKPRSPQAAPGLGYNLIRTD